MADITGKIYQMKNADGTENRFPRTVIEAVLGLSSYLQDQFSSLADIYMPIEGISEAFTGQEFVYRKSPNTIKAKSLTLDRIKGKSLVWNQLVQDNTGSGTGAGITFTRNADGSITINGTATEYTYNAFGDFYIVSGHTYLISIGRTGAPGADFSTYASAANVHTGAGIAANICVCGVSGITNLGIFISAGSSFDNMKVYPQLIDLTILFNGSIPEDYTVADFERDFPELYYPQNDGAIISNDAEAVETTGVNQWDEEWENGVYLQESGEPSSGPSRLRSKNYIPVFGGVAYYAKSPVQLVILPYDANKNYLGTDAVSFITNNVFTTPEDAAFIRFYTGSDLTQYNHDICINLSNPEINGQYFPYWKRILRLGLNNLKVKSHNLWDEEVEVVGSQLQSKNLIPVFPNTAYYITMLSFPAHYHNKIFYNAEGEEIGRDTSDAQSFTTPTDCAYMRFVLNSGYGTTYNHDICINLSSSFNGQYEPYGDITINGLKGAGSVYDEIVGNKYIKRMSRVDLGNVNWEYNATYQFFIGAILDNPSGVAGVTPNLICSKYETYGTRYDSQVAGGPDKIISGYSAAPGVIIYDTDHSAADLVNGHAAWLEGVMLDYELATPIEYDLVEPLIYTTKAGTTEERISPNSDGLSAPFCCDMTYSANENNDAGNAQYAATAGRLLNTHKIWGQDFNGSEDVSGALTGVTTLDASGLATLRGGISVPATADAKHGTLDFIDGDRIKHISVVTLEEYPASPDLNTLYIIYQD